MDEACNLPELTMGQAFSATAQTRSPRFRQESHGERGCHPDGHVHQKKQAECGASADGSQPPPSRQPFRSSIGGFNNVLSETPAFGFSNRANRLRRWQKESLLPLPPGKESLVSD